MVLRLSVPSVSCAGVGKGWSFSENLVRKLYSAWAECVHTDRIGSTVSCFDAVESCCVRSPAGDDVSCTAVVVCGGGCHFPNMTVPRAGTGNRESAGASDGAREGACIDGRLVVLVSSTGDSMR